MTAVAISTFRSPQKGSEQVGQSSAPAIGVGNGAPVDRDVAQAELATQAKKAADARPEGGPRYKDTLGAATSFLLHFAGSHPDRFKLDDSKAAKSSKPAETPAESTTTSVVGVPSERDTLARGARGTAEAEEKAKAERLKAEESAKAGTSVASSSSIVAAKTVA